MKRNRSYITSAIAIVLAVGIVACGATFGQKSKNMLLTTQEMYDKSWKAFVELYETQAKGLDGEILVDKDTFDRGRAIAIVYYDAWMEANYAVEAYMTAPDSTKKEVAEHALNAMSAAFSRMLGYINEFLPMLRGE